MRWVTEEEGKSKESTKGRIQVVIIDMSSKFLLLEKEIKYQPFCFIDVGDWLIFLIADMTNVDTAGILALEELHKKLMSRETEVRRWRVLRNIIYHIDY